MGTLTRIPTTEPGPRGLHGHLRLQAERVAGRTRLTAVEARPPLQVMAAHDIDPGVPDLATLTVLSPSGGILQGDHLELDAALGPAARLAVGTQSSTRVYRTPDAGATVHVRLTAGPSSYLEYLPDPWIPYAGSRLVTSTRCVVDPSATLLICEAVVAGRLARGERFALDGFESVVTVARPGDEPFVRDSLRIEPSEPPSAIGRFGSALAVATLLVVGPGIDAELVRSAVRPGVGLGVSALPDGAGAWLRVLGPDAGSVVAVVHAIRAVVRSFALGHPPTGDRRP
jgi:urease accessory protein